MAGIYIHIPFCVSKCRYCGFFSVADASRVEDYLAAAKKEMQWRKDYLSNEPVNSLYFGGGTPSVLSAPQIGQMIETVERIFPLQKNAEITLEANPNNLTDRYLNNLSFTPVNRLSLGVQSFFDSHLRFLGRTHTAKQAQKALEAATKRGFDRICADLMYGYPSLTPKEWRENLDRVKEIPHLSCYCLSLEPNTELHRAVNQGSLSLPDEEAILQQYQILLDFAQKNQFLQYEISNFCQKDAFSRHNTAYWQQEPYLGIGTGAHSFNRHSRQWNVCDISYYIRALGGDSTENPYRSPDQKLFQEEDLTPVMQFNEYLFTSLRTVWGCGLEDVERRFGQTALAGLRDKLRALPVHHYTVRENRLRLTKEGLLQADGIAAELFAD
jgi:oxygen-independent coproporphyrinogen-3 oxidase